MIRCPRSPSALRAHGCALAISTFIAGWLHAQVVFSGPGNDWFTTGNWSGAALPTSADDVFFYYGRSATITSPNAAARQLTLGGNDTGAVTVQSGGSGTSTKIEVQGGGTFTVTGTGTWNDSGDLAVYGTGANVTVSAGGQLATASNTADTPSGYVDYNGAVNVTGAGSTWTHSGLFWLYTGTVALDDHATATTGATSLSTLFSDNVSSVSVRGGAQWNTGPLAIAGSGTGSIAVDTGGRVAVTGDTTVRANGSVTMTGATSQWTNTGILTLDAGSFSVSGGQLTTATNPDLYSTTLIDNGGSLTLSNGASWSNPGSGTQDGNVTVGQYGTGTLTLQSGATASLASLTTGGASSATGNLLIDGTGSKLTTTAAGGDYIGFNGTSTVTISNGGRYDAQGSDFILGYGNPGRGSTLAVSGAGSQFNTAGHVSIGNFGEGTLTASNGASVTTGTDASIAFGVGDGLAGNIKGTATITGAGSSWTIGGNLGIGSYASSSDYTIGTLTVANGGTLTVGSGGTGIIQLDRKSTLNIGNGGTVGALVAGRIEFYTAGGTADSILAFNHTDDLTFSVPITSNTAWGGQGQVIKSGSGTLTLTGANSYDGPTWIKGGTIAVASLANLSANSALGAPTTAANGRSKLGSGTSDGTLRYTGGTASTNRGLDLAGTTGGGALDASGTGALTISGTVTASGAGAKTLTLAGTNTGANTLSGVISNNSASNTTALLKSGAGRWVLSGNNTFSGGVTVSAGTLRATQVNALGIGASTLTLAGGNLELAANAATSFSRNTTVSANATITADRTTNGAGVTHTLGTLAIGAQTLSVARGSAATSGTGGLTFGVTTLSGNATFSVGSSAQLNLGAVGETGGARSLTKSGAGTLVLTGDNTYTGGTTISAGTLQLGNGGAAGSVSGNIANNAALIVNRSGSLTLDGVISGSGTLTKSGGGTLTLAGNNSYAGATTISAGTVTITTNNALGAAAAGTTVASGATLALQGGFNYTTGESLTLNTGTTTGSLNNVSGTNSFAGAVTVSGSSRILAASGSQLTLSGVLSGSAQLSTNGGGTLVFSNANNSLSGAITIGGGTTLLAAANQALGSAGGNAVSVNSGTLAFASGVNYTSAKSVTFAGNGATGRNAAIDTLGGSATFAGTLQPSDPLATIGADAGTQLTLSGTISEYSLASGFGWGPTFVGPGTVVVSGSNSVTSFALASGTLRATTSANALGLGSLTLSGGSLELANDTPLAFNRATSVTGSVTLTSDRLTSGDGVTHTLGTLAIGAQTLTVNRGANATGTAGVTFGTTTLSGNATFAPAANAVLTLGAVGQSGGARALTKSGAGTLVLGGVNTYTGATSVEAGTLLVNGSLAATPLTVASGALLGGSGSIAGDTSLHGTLSPGNSPGVLTFGGHLTLAGDSFTLIQLAGTTRGTGYDGVDVGGTLTFGGTLNVVLLNDFTPALHDAFNVFDWTTGATGTFTALSLPALGTGLMWDTANLYTTGTLAVASASAVPEPATWAVIAGAFVLGLAMLHRRRRATLRTDSTAGGSVA